MKEKLLAALKTKFQGVSEKVLDRLATKKAETVENEDSMKTVVDGLTYQDVIDSEADYRAQQTGQSLSKKALEEYEKKHGLKDGKPIEDPDKKDPPKKTDPKTGDDPKDQEIAELKSSINKLTELVTGVVTGQQKASKQTQALDALKKTKIPEKLHQKWITRVDLESDESFEDQVKSLETEYLDITQTAINEKVEAGDFVGGSKQGEFEDAEVNSYLDDKFPSEAEDK